ncbi:MAG TPA: class II aldolase/adducin family protein, partial [Roseiarcus sp.]|nr:class II aldolase/adducin family protein [Roseiarcus sp.]
ASGAWLADALQRDLMTPIRLAPLLEAIESGDPRAENAAAFIDDRQGATSLRPSIETSVHAALPQTVVVHIHCVDTIALAVRADAEAAIASRLPDLSRGEWIFIPYVKPGLPLARAIRERLTAKTKVIVLGNHGLIVAAETVAEAAARTEQICGAFAASPKPAPAPDLDRLAALVEGGDYRLPHDSAAHATATDPYRLARARLGSFYPDHVVFLGPGIVEGTIVGGRLQAPALDRPAPMLVLPGLGVALQRGAPKGTDEMARCLAEVTGRIADGAPVVPLASVQEAELVNWEAEKYRRSLNAAPAAGRQ